MEEGKKKANERIWILPWLGAIAVLAGGLTFGPLIRGHSVEVRHDPTANDAPIGTRIELPASDVHGRAIDPLALTLLVYAGTCSSCSNSGIGPEQLKSAEFPQVLIVQIASSKQLLELYPAPRENVRMIADPEGRIVQQLGAVSSPRFYILESGRIREVWKQLNVLPEEWMGGDLK
jgi:hypothetical protein